MLSAATSAANPCGICFLLPTPFVESDVDVFFKEPSAVPSNTSPPLAIRNSRNASDNHLRTTPKGKTQKFQKKSMHFVSEQFLFVGRKNGCQEKLTTKKSLDCWP